MESLDPKFLEEIKKKRASHMAIVSQKAYEELNYICSEFQRKIMGEIEAFPFCEYISITVRDRSMDEITLGELDKLIKGRFKKYEREHDVWKIPIDHPHLPSVNRIKTQKSKIESGMEPNRPDTNTNSLNSLLSEIAVLKAQLDGYERKLNDMNIMNVYLERELKIKDEFINDRDKKVDEIIKKTEVQNVLSPPEKEIISDMPPLIRSNSLPVRRPSVKTTIPKK